MRAIDPDTGTVLWQDRLATPSYGATAIANDVALVPDTVSFAVRALDVATGIELGHLPLPGPPSSTPVVVGDSVFVGAGTRENSGDWGTFGTPPPPGLGSNPLSPFGGIVAFTLAGR